MSAPAYYQGRTAAVWQAALAPKPKPKPKPIELGTIGHDGGRLVLGFHRRLPASPAAVRHGLIESGDCHVCGDGGAERWDVDQVGAGSRLAFTAWVDAEDLTTAAGRGAEYHRCFERVAYALEHGVEGRRADDVDVAALVADYGAAFAAALADTD